MRFPKSKGQIAPTAMPGEFSPWLLLLAASLGWEQAMLWQQAMVLKSLDTKSLPDSLFQLPKDATLMSIPGFGP